MIILGIDPGIATMGYGVVESKGNKLVYHTHGCIYTTPDMALPARLEAIYDGVRQLIRQFTPDAVSVEELFFAKNVKTAITVAHARGATLLACQKERIPMFEYTPKQAKQAVVGYGSADKKQVQYMVRVLLNLKETPKPDDAADALALAICHSHTTHQSQSFAIS